MRKAIAIAALLTPVAVVGSAVATPPAKVSGTPPIRATFEDDDLRARGNDISLRTEDDADVVVQSLVFEPGGHSGWHRHPGVVVVAVKSGTLRHYNSRCRNDATYTAGEAFVEYGRRKGLVRNEGTVPAEVAVTYLVPKGREVRIDRSSPGCGIED
jgi:quercetin dioxygenase-like cupin family protein